MSLALTLTKACRLAKGKEAGFHLGALVSPMVFYHLWSLAKREAGKARSGPHETSLREGLSF